MGILGSSQIIDDQRGCRSMQDAVQILWPTASPAEELSATIFANRFRRPDGVETGMILLRKDVGHNSVLLRLTNFTEFKAINARGENVSMPVSVLNMATLHQDGVVCISDGQALRAITFKPSADMMYNFDLLDHQITRCALMFRPADAQRCFYNVSSDDLLGNVLLDFAQIARTKLSHLKRLFLQIQSCFPAVSEARIEQALRRAGFQFPQSPRGVRLLQFSHN